MSAYCIQNRTFSLFWILIIGLIKLSYLFILEGLPYSSGGQILSCGEHSVNNKEIYKS